MEDRVDFLLDLRAKYILAILYEQQNIYHD